MALARKYVAFDIETAKPVPEGPNPDRWHLGIVCAATLACDQTDPEIWYEKTADGKPAPRMTKATAAGLVAHLRGMTDRGYTVLTWNGLAFDYVVLASESDEVEECRRQAAGQVDMMFQVVCSRGHRLAMDRAAQGMGLPGKTPGMAGVMAPTLWAEGRFDEVLAYVARDVRLTLSLAQAAEARGTLQWISRQGEINRMQLPGGWLTVADAMRLPEPNTAGLTNPPSRREYCGWLTA